MTKLKILQYPDTALKNVAKPLQKENINEDLRVLIEDMFETMYDANGGGLAATQIGVNSRLFIMNYPEERQRRIVAINPCIIEKKGEILEEEGCLSFPGVLAKIKRAKWVKMLALDEFGKEYELESEGYVCRCIQHEIDHLNGITYFDHLSPLKRSIIEKKYKRIMKISM